MHYIESIYIFGMSLDGPWPHGWPIAAGDHSTNQPSLVIQVSREGIDYISVAWVCCYVHATCIEFQAKSAQKLFLQGNVAGDRITIQHLSVSV